MENQFFEKEIQEKIPSKTAAEQESNEYGRSDTVSKRHEEITVNEDKDSKDIFLDVDVDTDKTVKTTIPLDKDEPVFYDDSDEEEEFRHEEAGDYSEYDFEPSGLFTTRFEDKFNKGLRYLRAKDYNRALFFLKDAMRHDNNSYQVYMAIGHVYRHKGLYSEALDNYRAAIQKNKYSSNAYNYMGNIFYINKKYSLAVKAWEKAYAIDPGRTIIKKNIEKLKKVIDKTE